MFRIVFASIAAAVSLVPSVGEAAAPPSCPPDRPAAIAQSITPEIPPMAKISHQTGTATVRVDLSNTGSLLRAHVVRSSGSVVLDTGALDAVKEMGFASGLESCTHIGGSYDVDVTYPE